MTSNEIRSSFLKYFERNGHRILPSSPLVPHDDPTLLFTNAGMNQFKDLLLGKEQREFRRATTSQKVMRVSGKHNDLDAVGPSLGHHTFFEMLGNFSFGDYFKKDAIKFSWELLTDVWKIPPANLIVSIFKGEANIPRDDDAYEQWLRYVTSDRILELGLEDNFWQMGDTGPCGRCSEIYYVRGAGADSQIEIWNNVFMEFERQADGALKSLPAPSIDTGMGLERVTAVLQNRVSNYDTDLFTPLLAAIGDVAGTRHQGTMAPSDVSLRVVADHTRAMTFLIADGVLPSNEWRGYVLRKIMRRAMRHGKRLGITTPFLHRLVAVVDREMGDAYPEVRAGRAAIEQVIRSEEERFDLVLSGGLPRLEEALEEAASGNKQVPGELAFRLYDTFGLPLDFIEDLASDRRVGVDREGFDKAMEAQREKARAKSAFGGRKVEDFKHASAESEQNLRAAGDRFEGYSTTIVQGVRVLALFDERRRQVKELREGERGDVALEKTPFYLEAGGQISDSGRIYRETAGGEAAVEGMARISAGWPRLHRVQMRSGVLSERDLVTAEVDAATRDATRRNHTATHLLHAALRQVLGPHVRQAGSLVAPDRLRFDFAHVAPLTREQSVQIEGIVNEQIYRNIPVQTDERSTEEAIAAGATALFGEKYGDRVRVVSIPGFSMELCGGTHCRATGDIGLFTIVNEGGVAAGVRRIEAITGEPAMTRYQTDRETLRQVLAVLNVPAERAVETIERLETDLKRLKRERDKQVLEGLQRAGGVQRNEDTDPPSLTGLRQAGLVVNRVQPVDKVVLRQLADSHKNRLKSGVVLLASVTDEGKVSMVVSVSKDLTGRVHAGQIVKQLAPIVGGSGGGRPDFAEAGGKDASRVDEMLTQGERLIQELLATDKTQSPTPNP